MKQLRSLDEATNAQYAGGRVSNREVRAGLENAFGNLNPKWYRLRTVSFNRRGNISVALMFLTRLGDYLKLLATRWLVCWR